MPELQLGAPFSDHLVLQRGRENPIWGWDRAGQRVTLRVLGLNAVIERDAVAASDGRFDLSCPELPAGGPYRIEIAGSSTILLDDVLCGEVWLASGQSNMEWPVAAAADAERTIRESHLPALRQLKIPRAASRTREPRASAEWRVCGPDTVGDFSAVAHFFALELHARLGVPIGIIDATWGGTSIDAWTRAEALAEVDATVTPRLAEIEAQQRDLESLREAYRARLGAWERASFPADPPNVGLERGYAELAFDDRAWPQLELPTLWQRHGMLFNGVVWFRREVELADGGQSDLVLELGPIDDYDHTYFNGTLIGSHPDGTPNAFQTKRRYPVPRALVKPGKNVIAVRVFDHFGEGGFVGPRPALFIEAASGAGVRHALAGPWRYCVEHEIPLVPNAVFASWPAPPPALALESAPGTLFNGMLAPIIPDGLRGVIWYQGESDSETHASYAARFRAFIRDLRRQFSAESAWFLFVQLAGYRASGTWPLLREAQTAALAEPHTAMATTLDIGDEHDIHPKNKQEVGRRLALLARARIYGEERLADEGPQFVRAERDDSRVRIWFDHARGLHAAGAGTDVRGFELADRAGAFHRASARIAGEQVTLWSDEVPEPVAVRYAWADFPDANLTNRAQLPAVAFRARID